MANGKDIFGKIGSETLKVLKVAGIKLKDGATYLYDNKEEILDGMQSKYDNKKERAYKQIEFYKRRLSNYSEQDLKSIIRNEKEEHLRRVAAQEILKERR